MTVRGPAPPPAEALALAHELADAAGVVCRSIANAMPPDDEVGMRWAFPSRQTWERGDRTLSCVIGRIDGTSWDGPSGLTPPPST